MKLLRSMGWPLLVLVAMCFIALLAPLLATHDPYSIDLARRLEAPSLEHLFGTDEVGRDLFSRVVYGTRPTLFVAFSVVTVVAAFGFVIGLFAGMGSKLLDFMVMRVADVGLSIPGLVIVIAFSAAAGPGIRNAILGLIVILLPGYIRLARNQAVLLRGAPFIDAARTFGAGSWALVRRHVARNTIDPIIVQATVDFGHVVLALAALSFIGLGVQPPDADWGAIMSSGRRYGSDSWWYVLWPGIFVVATAAAAGLLGDRLVAQLNVERAR